jgi:alpha-methylacyl-CoA racemase
MADVFRTRTRDEWCRILEGSDACFSPVLDWDEAPRHPHNRARETFVSVDGVVQPAPAPRFSRTPAAPPRRRVSRQTQHVLRDWGLSEAGIARWRGSPSSTESSVPPESL